MKYLKVVEIRCQCDVLLRWSYEVCAKTVRLFVSVLSDC